ncbi:MAG: glycoside hydrolase family 3 protein [Eubacterium sp.]|nr:glycoside hydrolase family 3 protein [Eubacterium sp.]
MKLRLFKLFCLGVVLSLFSGCGASQKETVYEKAEADEEEVQEEAVEEEPVLSAAEKALSEMSTDEKIYQLFFVTPEALTGEEAVTTADKLKTALADCPVGGVIFFSKNLESVEQTKALLGEAAEGSKIPLFLGIDEEGGTVSRLSELEGLAAAEIPPMAEIGATENPNRAYEAGQIIGSDLKALGFNMDFAPVADVLTNLNNTEIGSRAFSSDPSVCASMAAAVIKGLHSENIGACAKHFPGHGSTTDNSHEGKSVTNRTLEEFRSEEFVPFKAAISAGTDFVMVSHMTAESLDEIPCSLSEKVISLLRDELNFENIIITDAQNMGAITGFADPTEASLMSLSAGADMVLMPLDFEASVNSVKQAVSDGTLSEEELDEKVLRILTVKEERGLLAN